MSLKPQQLDADSGARQSQQSQLGRAPGASCLLRILPAALRPLCALPRAAGPNPSALPCTAPSRPTDQPSVRLTTTTTNNNDTTRRGRPLVSSVAAGWLEYSGPRATRIRRATPRCERGTGPSGFAPSRRLRASRSSPGSRPFGLGPCRFRAPLGNARQKLLELRFAPHSGEGRASPKTPSASPLRSGPLWGHGSRLGAVTPSARPLYPTAPVFLREGFAWPSATPSGLADRRRFAPLRAVGRPALGEARAASKRPPA